MIEIRWCKSFHRVDRYISKDKSAEIYIGGFKKYCEFLYRIILRFNSKQLCKNEKINSVVKCAIKNIYEKNI